MNSRPVDIFRKGKGMGDLDHLVLVRGYKDRVQGLVTFFGHLQFCVDLGPIPKDATVATAYRLDPLGAKDRLDDRGDRRVPVRRFCSVARMSHKSRLHHMGAAVRRVLAVAMPIQRQTWQSDMIDKVFADVLGKPDGRLITDDDINRLSHEIAVRFVRGTGWRFRG